MEVLCLHLLIFCVREHRFIQVEKWFCETVTLSPAQCCVNTDFSPDFSGFYPLGSCNSSRMESAQSLWAACSTVLFLYMVIWFFFFCPSEPVYISMHIFLLNRFFLETWQPKYCYCMFETLLMFLYIQIQWTAFHFKKKI